VTDDYFEFDGVMLESSAIQEADNKRPTWSFFDGKMIK
jgi:hypothetical protein